jgi:hypothetical protein
MAHRATKTTGVSTGAARGSLHKPLGHSMIFELGRHSGGLGVPSSNLGAPTRKTSTNQRLYQVATCSRESTNRGQKGGVLTYSVTQTTGATTGALRAFSVRSRGGDGAGPFWGERGHS